MSIQDPSDYKTGSAVPSGAAMDVNDNAKVFDVFQNAQVPSVITRLGDEIKTVWQYEQDFITSESARDKAFDSQFMFKRIKSFSEANAAGEKITDATRLNSYSTGSNSTLEWWGLIQSTTIPDDGLPIPSAPDDNWSLVSALNLDYLLLNSVITFNQVSDIDLDNRIKLGMSLTVENYYSDINSGRMFFTVVPPGTGTHDGGKYIDLPSRGLQLKQNLPLRPSVKNWGAKGDSSHDDTASCLSMNAYKGYIQLSGLNRVTSGFVIENQFNFRMYGDGMFSGKTKLIIDHSEPLFKHGGNNFSSDGFKLQDIHIVLAGGRTPSTEQHFYMPLSAQGWKEWKNVKVDGIGGLINAYPGDGVDVYCQRFDVDNVRFNDCGAWAGILGDETVSMKRPFGTICQIGDIDLKAMRGHPAAIAWFDMRGWRQIEQTGTVEIGNAPTADQYTNIKSVAAYKSNSPLNINTIWYEPYPQSVTNIDTIIFCDQYPPSNVDGEAGTVIKINDIEATRQGADLNNSWLVRFAEDTFYDVQIETVGSTYSYYIPPNNLINFGVPLLQNKNKVSIKNFFWRYEPNKPLMPFPLPDKFFGHFNIENAATNTNNVRFPLLEFDNSPKFFEWQANDSAVPPDDNSVKTNMMDIDLSVNVDTKGFASHKGSIAYNIARNNGVPRIRYNVKANSNFYGAWCTIAVSYVNVSSDTGSGKPVVISNSNGDGANAFVVNTGNKNGSGYSTAFIIFQIQKDLTRLDAYFEGSAVTGANNFYIRSVVGRLGLKLDMNKLYK